MARPRFNRLFLLGLAWILVPLEAQAQIVFQDVSAGTGVEFKSVSGADDDADKGWIVEYMGSGAAWLDYDGDGQLDLYLTNGSQLDRPQGKGEPNRMYRGDGKGRFTDVTAATGTGDRGWGYGVTVGDIDNDGDPDIYAMNVGRNTLYRNRGDGTFEDATDAAGVGHGSWSTSGAFFDMEGDGDLDLFVGHYVDFVQDEIPRRGSKRAEPPYCVYRGIDSFCGPRGLRPARNVMFRNNGDGTFSDVTKQAGMWLERPRYTLGVVTFDYDNDGDQDVFVANDSVMNSLWQNDGKGKFKEVGLTSLVALDGAGNPQGCMGTAAGDYNGDGYFDLVVTNFSHDLNTVYKNLGGTMFVDESIVVGMNATAMELSWGTAFEDFDNDGDVDLFIANGHAYPEVDSVEMGTKYRQANHIFQNEGDKFLEVSSQSGKAMSLLRSFRGSAFGDYDADGDVDIVVTAMDEAIQLLRNDAPADHHWLKLRLVGTVSNRDAVGARVTLVAGGKTQIRERMGGGSYLSASDPDLHFGLGGAATVDSLTVRWPSGLTTELKDVKVDQRLTITEKR